MKKRSLLNELTLCAFNLAGDIVKPSGIPILHYHSVNGENKASVTKESFCEQMNYLHENNYNVISLSSLIEMLEKKRPLKKKTLVITFDDGYKTNYDIAFPLLSQYSFTATIFITTGAIGKVNDWDDIEGVKGLPILSAEEIKEMERGGIDFGVHTDTHPDLTAISPEMIRAEINLSKTKLENLIGKEVTHFAYPYGKYTDEVRTMVKECGIKAACTTKPGLSNDRSDLFLLNRSGVFTNASINGFKTRLNGSFAWYFNIKKRVR